MKPRIYHSDGRWFCYTLDCYIPYRQWGMGLSVVDAYENWAALRKEHYIQGYDRHVIKGVPCAPKLS